VEARRADSRNLSRAVLLLLALAAALLLAAALSPTAMASAGGSLYTQTNDPSGNAVQTFDRGRDGSLTPAGTFPTGGAGLVRSAGARAPSSSAATAARCMRSTPAPTASRCSAPATAACGWSPASPRAASRPRASPSTAAASTS